MERKNSYRRKRTIWVWVGLGVLLVSYIADAAFWSAVETEMWATAESLSYLADILAFFGIGAVIYGSYCWAKYKGRHGAFALLGLLAPIGFIPLALMKDKYPVSATEAMEVKERNDGQGQ